MIRNLLFVFCTLLSIYSYAQIKESFPIRETFQHKIKDYEVTAAKNAYELVRNLAYTDQCNYAKEDDFIGQPLVLVNNQPHDIKDLKHMPINRISLIEFKQGLEVRALYGTSAEFGMVELKVTELSPQ